MLTALMACAPLGATMAQPFPVPTTPGTVLVYSVRNGSTVVDSVASHVGDTVRVQRRTTDPAGRQQEAERRFVRTTRGIELFDAGGAHLLMPSRWPAVAEWDFVYGGIRYRYAPLRTESVSTLAGRFEATVVQVIASGIGSGLVADLWLVPSVGFVRRQTRPDGNQGDYELIQIRQPRVFASSAPQRYARGPELTLGALILVSAPVTGYYRDNAAGRYTSTRQPALALAGELGLDWYVGSRGRYGAVKIADGRGDLLIANYWSAEGLLKMPGRDQSMFYLTAGRIWFRRSDMSPRRVFPTETFGAGFERRFDSYWIFGELAHMPRGWSTLGTDPATPPSQENKPFTTFAVGLRL